VLLRLNILLLLLLQLILVPAFTQTVRIPLFLIITDSQPNEELTVKSSVQSDSLIINKHLSEVLDNYYRKGYLAASIDSFHSDTNKVVAYCHKGQQFRWVKVSFDSSDLVAVRKAEIRTGKYQNKQIDPIQLLRDQQKLVGLMENTGYPFASANLVNMKFEGNLAEGLMHLERGPLIRIDSIIIKGNAKISPKYFQKQIGIEKDDLYQERKILAITDRIKETTFLREIKPFEIEFINEKADIYTYLEKKRANQFNGIIGIIPNNETTGKLLLTGDVSFSLVNLFSRGIFFGMNWKKLEPLTQELNMTGSYPYIFNSSVGIGMNLFFLKQDTTYFRVEPEVELQYFFNGSNYIRIFYQSQASSLLSTNGLEDITVLPAYADYKTSLYGAGIKFNKLDYLYNPRRGIYIEGDMSVGSKKIKKNPDINEDVYTNLDLTTTKTVLTSGIYMYLPMGGNFVAQIKNLNGFMFNENLFENELFRVGGIRNLRGVDENSITASSYILGSLEFRYLFEEQSNLFLFMDGGYYQNKISQGEKEDTPLGFGAGMNLQTRAGIFSISYAMGRQFDNPVNIANSKVHIGYIQRF
jgi:outer membrane protein assembly factor BamA